MQGGGTGTAPGPRRPPRSQAHLDGTGQGCCGTGAASLPPSLRPFGAGGGGSSDCGPERFPCGRGGPELRAAGGGGGGRGAPAGLEKSRLLQGGPRVPPRSQGHPRPLAAPHIAGAAAASPRRRLRPRGSLRGVGALPVF